MNDQFWSVSKTKQNLKKGHIWSWVFETTDFKPQKLTFELVKQQKFTRTKPPIMPRQFLFFVVLQCNKDKIKEKK